MPEGIEDNYVDEMFLKGLVHKSISYYCESYIRQFPWPTLSLNGERDTRDNPRSQYSSSFLGTHFYSL